MNNTSPKFFCFVLMPFTKDFDDIYKYGIKASCIDAGTYCERVDEQNYNETILARIYNQIAKADLIIADMSGRNPNVFYEVGYAHALNKPTILLTRNADDIPFDLKHFHHIVYDGNISTIREQLTKRVQWFKENRGISEKIYHTKIEIYVDDKNLSSEKVIHEYEYNQNPNFNFTIHNNSAYTYQSSEFQIAIITEIEIYNYDNGISTSRLPNRTYFHMLPYFDQLFPNAYTSYFFEFYEITSNDEYNDHFELIIRVFSEAGSRDYILLLKRKENPMRISMNQENSKDLKVHPSGLSVR